MLGKEPVLWSPTLKLDSFAVKTRNLDKYLNFSEPVSKAVREY